MIRPALLLCALAFWPVWTWQLARLQDGSDDPFGLLALIAAAVFLVVKGRRRVPSAFQCASAAAFTLVYAGAYHMLPPLVRGVLALSALACIGSAACETRKINFALWGLAILSLPLVASLQFYLGFPVRFVTAQIAAEIITLAGYPTEALGTTLSWCGENVVVDAPCAGIKMLWSGLFIAFTGALFREFGFLATWVSYSAAVIVIFIGNLIRNVALFFTEAHIIAAPPWMHDAIGLTAIFIVATMILFTQIQIAKLEERYARA